MQVLKFGGTSVADASSMAQCAAIISKAVDRDRTIVVGSAISGCTDALIKIGNLAAKGDVSYLAIIDEIQERHHRLIKELLPKEKTAESLASLDAVIDYVRGIAQGVCLLGELSETSLDAIQGCGELMSTRILATKMASMGIATRWVDSRKIVKTHHERGKNVVDQTATYRNIAAMVEADPSKELFIVPGFIASDEKGRMTTLGRGGSDYSASIFAAGSKARALETWKDVPGIMTANPKIVPNARPITSISYRAALELSHFGAKVLYAPTIQPVVAERIPIYVKCTFDPSAEGTVIEQNPPRGKEKIIGLSNSDNIALLSLEGTGMVGVPGISTRLIQTLSDNDIDIILITQASSVNTMCVAISETDAVTAKEAVDKCFAYEISLGKLNPLKVETGYSIVCLVGDDILNQRGTTGRMLDALGRRNVGVRAVAQGSSERNISVIIDSKEVGAAMRYIHKEFFEVSPYKEINIFVAGYGTVGKAFIDMLARNRASILERTGKRLHLCGLSNSRKFVIDTEGLDASKAGELLAGGHSAADDAFYEALSGISLQNSVFVDCTASSDIPYIYTNLFRFGYSVVACNKIPFSASYESYKALKAAAVRNGVTLRYETTVGAALPVLESIARCVNCDDGIESVEAVLSGTMNYIFSTYDGTRSFSEVVREAQDSGYTEPDPRLDLSGRDVLRKLLIMAREAGVAIEESDVEVDHLLGAEYFSGSVEEFYDKLSAAESGFKALYRTAAENGERLRYVASLERTADGWKAKMGLTPVRQDNPLYNLYATDNAAIIRTELYPSPLVIKGAGAGAYQTASGILNDIVL